jgi:glycerate kinase
MRILVAPNCFKECADAISIAHAIREELTAGLPEAEIVILPVSDGGDGFLDVCAQAEPLEFSCLKVPAIYNDGKAIDVRYGIDRKRQVVFIESAEVIGLAKTPPAYRQPLYLSSLSLGKLLKTILNIEPGLKKTVIGLGGTAINDLGLGCAEAFGLQVLNGNGEKLHVLPVNFKEAATMIMPTEIFPVEIELVTDVQADLFGENGTSRLFSPQKGASPEDVEALECGVLNILTILEKQFHLSYKDKKIGAAGGVGLGISLFANIKLITAKEYILAYLKLMEHIKAADYVITAEGAYDSQSKLQKAPDIILNEARKMEKGGVLIAGNSSITGGNADFPIFTLSEHFCNTEESIKNYRKGIKLVCQELINYIQKSS